MEFYGFSQKMTKFSNFEKNLKNRKLRKNGQNHCFSAILPFSLTSLHIVVPNFLIPALIKPFRLLNGLDRGDFRLCDVLLPPERCHISNVLFERSFFHVSLH